MKRYRILIWFPGKFDYYDGLFKSLNAREDTVCKDKSEFGFAVDYYSQLDYDKVQSIFCGNIILLYQITKNELYIDISDDIIVWSYLDDIFGKFVMIGKDYFTLFPKNNYMYLPLLDIAAFDLDQVMQSEELYRKAVVAPFVPLQYDYNHKLTSEEEEKFSSDIALILFKKRIGDAGIKRMAGVNEDNACAKDVLLLIGMLYAEVDKKMKEEGHIVTDLEWIENTLIYYFDKFHIWQYMRNKEALLEKWKRLVLYVINVNLYGDNIVDWLIEGDYNFKLYGGWSEKKYKKYSMGYLRDGSTDMYCANYMAKIGINSNPLGTIHRRTIDCMSSGTMCMSAAASTRELDVKYNFSHYSHFFEDQKDIIMFHNKEELLSNIDYYLSHDEERERIALNGKLVISERKLDYVSVVNRAFEDLISRIEDDETKII